MARSRLAALAAMRPTYAWDASGARRCTFCEQVWPAAYLGVPHPLDESGGPFPSEPAFGSPEAVAQAAELLRANSETTPLQLPPEHREAYAEEAGRAATATSWPIGSRETYLERENDRLQAEVDRLQARDAAMEQAIALTLDDVREIEDGVRLLTEQRDELAKALLYTKEAIRASIETEEAAKWDNAGDCELEAENAHAIYALEQVDLSVADAVLQKIGRQ